MKLFLLLTILLIPGFKSFAQEKVPVVRTKMNSLIMYVDKERGNFNNINDIPNPFTYGLGLENENSTLGIVSEKDSISMPLRYGEKSTFMIIREQKGDTLMATFTSHRQIKAALFNDGYKKRFNGKVITEIPEVYELINIVFALTDYGKTEAIYKGTDYYKSVNKHFQPFSDDSVVKTIDSVLKVSSDMYAPLKMDSYAYQFDNGRIVKHAVFDRASWGEVNELTPYIPALERFAKKSGFKSFYKENVNYYAGLIADFEKNVDVGMMKSWLEKQFPKTKYSAIRVIFSPLVGWNQSANNFEDNGFKEAHAHINFPFVPKNNSVTKEDPDFRKGQRMMIAFTEINHSYLNPEAEIYVKEISKSFGDLTRWITPGKPSGGYNNVLSCFEEYMNYGLVTLLYSDVFDEATFSELKAGMENNMVNGRGFLRFKEFNEELLRLYQSKKTGETVADLYPAVIKWAGQ